MRKKKSSFVNTYPPLTNYVIRITTTITITCTYAACVRINEKCKYNALRSSHSRRRKPKVSKVRRRRPSRARRVARGMCGGGVWNSNTTRPRVYDDGVSRIGVLCTHGGRRVVEIARVSRRRRRGRLAIETPRYERLQTPIILLKRARAPPRRPRSPARGEYRAYKSCSGGKKNAAEYALPFRHHNFPFGGRVRDYLRGYDMNRRTRGYGYDVYFSAHWPAKI